MESERTNKHERVTVDLEGRVQGVGFRFTTVDVASRFAVTGFVRNEYDGTVRVVAEGAKSELEAFLAAIYRSQVGPYIRGARQLWGEADGSFKRFDVRYG